MISTINFTTGEDDVSLSSPSTPSSLLLDLRRDVEGAPPDAVGGGERRLWWRVWAGMEVPGGRLDDNTAGAGVA